MMTPGLVHFHFDVSGSSVADDDDDAVEVEAKIATGSDGLRCEQERMAWADAHHAYLDAHHAYFSVALLTGR